jgi:hypothetical protein
MEFHKNLTIKKKMMKSQKISKMTKFQKINPTNPIKPKSKKIAKAIMKTTQSSQSENREKLKESNLAKDFDQHQSKTNHQKATDEANDSSKETMNQH